MTTTNIYKNEAAGFWTKKGDQITVIGDVLGRLPGIELLSPKPSETILDVGCGAGWVTRRIAHSQARMLAFDQSSTMLEQAISAEKEQPLGIKYWLGDLTRPWQVESNSVDAVSCIAVLMHATPEEVRYFFQEARRVLKPGGRVVVSNTHREVLRLQQTEGLAPGWCYHENWGAWDSHGSAEAVEHYFDATGNEFVAHAWFHDLGVLARHAGFKTVETYDRSVTRESLDAIFGARSATWPIGYPAFEQVLAR